MTTLFEHAGGEAALHRLEQLFYDSVLRDPLLRPLFGDGQPRMSIT
jgi:hemoglobin